MSRGGSYDHPCLTKLVEPAAYAAPDTFDVEKIVDHRGTGPRKEYLVKWTGYRIENWLGLKELQDCREKVKDYEYKYWQDLQENEEKSEKEGDEESEK